MGAVMCSWNYVFMVWGQYTQSGLRFLTDYGPFYSGCVLTQNNR